MSIAQAAQLVRAQGRGPDTELMHVTPGEVQALQGLAQLHGGSLTRNPQTGLPEASFLQSILPTLAGVGIGFATGNPLLGAAVAGGLGYGTSGSLEKGLLSGIGAFGGASALTSLAGVGAAGAGAGAAGAAGAGGAGTAGTALSTSIGGASIPATTAAGIPTTTMASGVPVFTDAGAAMFMGAPSGVGAPALTSSGVGSLPVGSKFSALGQGFQNLFTDPSATFSAMGGLKGQGLNLAMAGAPLLGGMLDSQQGPAAPPPQESLIRPQVYDPVTQTYTPLEPVQSSDWGTRSFEDYRRQFGFQEGGQVGIAALPQSAGAPAFQAGGDMESNSFIVPADVVSALGNGSTEAGVEVLNQYLGMALPIQGPGDGLSDDIPATIDGEQPARVADGEVYVPPEVVAQLGDGDYERGSAKLYAMMDRIREKAHGNTEQQAEVRPEEVMPQ